MAGFSMALMTGQTLGPAIGGAVAGLAGWRAAQGVGGADRRRRDRRLPARARRPRAARRERAQRARRRAVARAGRRARRRCRSPSSSRSARCRRRCCRSSARPSRRSRPRSSALRSAAAGSRGSPARRWPAPSRTAYRARRRLYPSLLIMAVAVLMLAPPPTMATWLPPSRCSRSPRPGSPWRRRSSPTRCRPDGRAPARHVPLHRRLRPARRPGRRRPALPALRPRGRDVRHRRGARRLRTRGGPARHGAAIGSAVVAA